MEHYVMFIKELKEIIIALLGNSKSHNHWLWDFFVYSEKSFAVYSLTKTALDIIFKM
jgi:hypothetical protein